MSVYHHYPSYAHTGYPPQGGYPQAPLPPPSRHSYGYPPPPAPVYPHDPTSFRHDYMGRLSHLEFNSRPMIQSLSMTAQEFSRWADIVAQCLEEHIRMVEPYKKLPAFYVLDAISKNVYDPYASLFSSFIAPLFLESYRLVDSSTRSKMEEMLLTWRTGSPSGTELFGIGPQMAIERGVWPADPVSATSHRSNASNSISRAQVISELEFTLNQKQRIVQNTPWDTVAQHHVRVLHQLRQVVESGVSSSELRDIQKQLRDLQRAVPPPVPPQAPPAQPYAAPPPVHVPAPAPAHAMAAPTGHMYPQSHSAVPVPSIVPPTQAAPAINPVDVLAILERLKQNGTIPSSSVTPQGAGETATSADTKMEVDPDKEARRRYRKAILSQPIKLNSSDIAKKRTDVVRFLYDELPSQCKQCGARFPETHSGKKAMEHHLDLHFRQNRKANQHVGRGHSRSWFVSVEDWVHDTGASAKGKGPANGFRARNAKQAAAEEAAKREAELRASFVVVPPGDEAKLISCPICKEVMKSEFLEEDEDWVWKNAIRKDEKVYHATCHAEATSNTIAARLRNEAGKRSRSNTPDATAVVRNTPPKPSGLRTEVRASASPSHDNSVAGVKRKVDSEDSGVTSEGRDSPAAKKVAVEAAA